jgi:hypothetical protein
MTNVLLVIGGLILLTVFAIAVGIEMDTRRQRQAREALAQERRTRHALHLNHRSVHCACCPYKRGDWIRCR